MDTIKPTREVQPWPLSLLHRIFLGRTRDALPTLNPNDWIHDQIQALRTRT